MDGKSKISGYGTALVSKDWGLVKWVEVVKSDLNFEILAAMVGRGRRVGLVIIMYRSPNMKEPVEIEKFYETICNTVNKVKSEEDLDYIVVVGDDNKTLPNVKRCAEKWLGGNLKLKNMIGSTPTRIDPTSGKPSQPDSCWAWMKKFRVRVCASVPGKIFKKMDHRPIRVKLFFKGVKPRLPQFRKVEREVKCQSDEKIDGFLESEMEMVCRKYSPFVEIGGCSVTGEVVDACCVDIMNAIKKSKEFGWRKVEVLLPCLLYTSPSPRD